MSTLGILNNNPSNIRHSDAFSWEGQTGSNKGFAQFDSKESGVRATVKNLQSYNKKGINTINDIINRWAPPNENHTASYVDYVSSSTGIDANTPLNFDDEDTMVKLMTAIGQQENGADVFNANFDEETVRKGVRRAMGKGENLSTYVANKANNFTDPVKTIHELNGPFSNEDKKIETGINTKPNAFTPEGFQSAQYSEDNFKRVTTSEEPSFWDGTWANIAHNFNNSPIVRGLFSKEDFQAIVDFSYYQRAEDYPTPEDMAKYKESGIPTDYLNMVVNASPENREQVFKNQMEYWKGTQELAKTSGIGATIAGSVGYMLGDPITYATWGWGAGAIKGATLAQTVLNTVKVASISAASSGLSLGIQKNTVGAEAGYTEAMVGGAILGVGLSSLMSAGGTVTSKIFGKSSVARTVQDSASLSEGGTTATYNIHENATPVQVGDITVHDIGGGDVRLPNGTIISAENPLNPMSLEIVDQANAMVTPELGYWQKFGSFSHLGNIINSSKVEGVNEIGSQLMNGTVLRTDGSTSLKRMSAESIHGVLHGRDNLNLEQLDVIHNGAKKAYGTAEEFDRAISEAIEAGDLSRLPTQQAKDYAEKLIEFMDSKAHFAENPHVFGNQNARPLFQLKDTKGKYVPIAYNIEKTNGLIEKLGSLEDAQKFVANNMLESYNANPQVKARVDELMLNGDYTDVADYAMRKAYGILAPDSEFKFTPMDIIESISGRISKNNYLEARHGFEMNTKTFMPDGTEFSLNDIRHFDLRAMLPSYARKINGDISIMGATGKTIQELQHSIAELAHKNKGNPKALKDIDGLTESLKVLTGVARRNPKSSGEVAATMLTDITLGTKGAYMAVQNYIEGASLITTGAVKYLLGRVPLLKNLSSSNHVPFNVIKDIQNAGWGKELSVAFRPSRKDWVQSLAMTTNGADNPSLGNKILGTMKYGTQEMSQRLPYVKGISGTVNHMTEAAQYKVIADLAESAHFGDLSHTVSDKFLNYAGVSKQQLLDVQNLIKEHTQLDSKGLMEFKSPDAKAAMVRDPRFMAMWRLGDAAAGDVTLRNHKASFARQGTHSAYMGLLTQFKMFTVDGVNGKTIKNAQNAYYNQSYARTGANLLTELGLSAAFLYASSHVKSWSIADEQKRRIYLDTMFDPTYFLLNSALRSSTIGAAGGFLQMGAGLTPWGDPLVAARTTVDQNALADYMSTGSKDWTASGFLSRGITQIPSIQTADNIGKLGYNLFRANTSNDYVEKLNALSGVSRGIKSLIPNGPLEQYLMSQYMENY